ncbi:hypothetical protein [Pinisolibacter aquiterrae]|uniref:hypothetical protein n=1 Tax=Pinisolibacter aquiterrae TaxID=2815579 RepID=UPI001E530940|nr:hypothetical protein [Pinisolibacter aquiterrae]MCC8235799.1 hypothetical protein [Pinisolibacter aquiterrae]
MRPLAPHRLDHERPRHAERARLAIEALDGAQQAVEKIGAFDRPAEDKPLPLGAQRPLLAQSLAMRLVELTIELARLLGRLGFPGLFEIVLLGVRQTIGMIKIEEFDRFLRKVRLPLPQTGENLLDAVGFPLELRQGLRLGLPTGRRLDKGLDRGMDLRLDFLPDRLELRPQVLGFDDAARRPLLFEQRTAVAHELAEQLPPARRRRLVLLPHAAEIAAVARQPQRREGPAERVDQRLAVGFNGSACHADVVRNLVQRPIVSGGEAAQRRLPRVELLIRQAEIAARGGNPQARLLDQLLRAQRRDVVKRAALVVVDVGDQ